jgi:hypothetical protein
VPHEDEELAFAVDAREAQFSVVCPYRAENAFDSIGVRGGCGLQAVEAHLAIAEVESIERGANSFASWKPALR